MGVSIQQYRQRIGCFARVATILSSFKVRGYRRNTFPKQSKDFGIALRIVIRLSCLVLVAAVIPSSLFVLDLTQFGDVEKNPGPNSDQKYKFHLIRPDEFEELAVIILKETYKIPFSKFKDGKDGGRDAVAKRSNIDLGGGNVLTNQNIVVQVKHTKNQSATFNDGTRNRVFGKEKNKVKKLVDDKELDIYIIVTNYELTAGQTVELQKMFKECKAKEVFVVGYNTLSLWLDSSPELKTTVRRLYPAVVPTTDLSNCVQLPEQLTTVDSNSTSESCESPPKRPRLQSDDNIKEILSDEYKDRASRIHPLPWLDTTRFELDKVYTRLGIVQRENTRSKLTDKTVELSDIFDKHEYTMCEDPRTILIEGSPGMGKTTLSLKIAYDWAMGRMPSKFPPVQLVLLIKCRDMKGNILEAIDEQLFPLDEDSLKNKLHTFIKEQPEKILLVVDGLDEITQSDTEHVMNLLTRTCLRKCYVVATSRQEKGLKVRKYFNTLLEIKGYSKSDIGEYITRYFQDNDPSFGERLIENLQTDINLETLATNPLNTVLVCVVFEDNEGKLPPTVTKLYDKIVFSITKRYCQKYGLSVEDSLLETSKETLGRLAYKGLLEDALSFRESDLNDKCTKKMHCIKMGFLYKEDSKQKIKQDHTYWFLHKTFQEYFSAFYLTEEVVRQKLTVDDMIDELKDTEKFMQVLKFVSGILHEKDAVHHMAVVEKLGTVLLQSMEKDKVLDVLCEILSESPVDKDMADIIHQFLPENLFLNLRGFPYQEFTLRILPRILNLLCTKDGVNKEVYFQKLSLSYHKISTSDLGLISKALKERLKVSILDFNECALRDETARDLADMLSHNSTVEELSLDSNLFTAEAAKILAGNLRQNTTLKELHFACNDLGDVGVKAITAALTPDTSLMGMATRNNDNDHSDREDGRRWIALHYLSLQITNCGEQGALAVAEMLRSNDTLLQLDIPNNPLGCKGVTYIAEALKSNRTLNYLDLTETDCSDEGAAALADMLRSNKTLEKLLIPSHYDTEPVLSNKVGKDGAVALADALRDNNSLKELHLKNNDITDEGLKCLAKALLKNTALEELCVNYSGDGMAALDQDTRERVKERITWHCVGCTEI